ncbi:substrate-binding domain-containing protein [Oleiharenicola lentus]|uniref:substrate-binding domain-containing protein n=1 Tax=Oleiharenicola lentus TaxID=2508720 RepID=UPI003F66B18F
MNSSALPFHLPTRLSLSAQAADLIANAIDNGTWQDSLPSERRLCEMLKVSRPTVRTALRILAKKGIVEIRHGRRNRLLKRAGSAPSAQSRVVGLVTHEPFSHMTLATYQVISEMRAHLADQGFTTEVLVCPMTASPRMQRHKLEEFVTRNRVYCCALLSVSKEVQKWFSTHSVPALVLGSCHAEFSLPSLDIDYRSVCRHAGGVFLSKGHRHMAFVVPNSGVAGDLASEVGFRESVKSNHQAEAHALIVRHNGTAQNIIRRLDALFNSAQPPTALLVAKPQYVFIVILYLLQRGLAVPDTVSLMARDYDRIFEGVSPPIAHYTLQDDTFAHRLSRLILQIVNNGLLSPKPNLIFPKFFAGGTVKQLA